MREGFGPHGTIGCRLTDESTSSVGTDPEDVLAAAAAVGDDGLADYLSVTLGSSPTYRGSTWIVPPSPAARNAVADFARAVRARTSDPADRRRAGARSGRRRPPDRRRRLRRGRDDAGPDRRPQPGAAGARGRADHALHRLQPGVHRPLPRRRPDRLHREPVGRLRAQPPAPCTGRTAGDGGRRRSRPGRLRRRRIGRRVRAPGRGLRARRPDAGGQMRLALAAPGHAEVAEGLLEILARLARRRWTSATAPRRRPPTSWRSGRTDVVVATGADPYLPAIGGDGVDVVDAWAALAGAPVGDRVVVSDWGGDWTGLDTAEALAARGAQVRLVTSAVAFGEGVHQYQRNLYLARLDDAGVELQPPPAARSPVAPRHGDLRERLLRARGRDRRRGHARGERRPDGRRRASTSSWPRQACPSSGPATAWARARSRRRSARARWPASGRENSGSDSSLQPVSTWRGRAAPRSMGSIGVQTASSPQPGQ